MAYQTGTAATATALLTTLVTWLNSLGWTTDASAADGLGHRAHLHKGSVYLNFRAAMLEAVWANNEGSSNLGRGLALYLGTGYSGAAAWNAQAGGPSVSSQNHGVGVMLSAGPFPAYHFHDDGADNVVVIVEHTGGIFGFLGFGLALSKETHNEDQPYFFGSTSGYATTTPRVSPLQVVGTLSASGSYPFATLEASNTTVGATGFVKVNSTFQPANNQWISTGVGTVGPTGNMGVRLGVPVAGHNSYTLGVVDNQFPHWRTLANAGRGVAQAYPRAQISPVHLFAPHPSTSRWTYLGYPPSVYACDAVGNGWASGETLTVGGLDYRLYRNMAVRYIP